MGQVIRRTYLIKLLLGTTRKVKKKFQILQAAQGKEKKFSGLQTILDQTQAWTGLTHNSTPYSLIITLLKSIYLICT